MSCFSNLDGFKDRGWWPYSCCFVRCCLQDLFNIARSILVQLLSSFFSIRLVSIHVVHPYSSTDTTAPWKKLCFILSDSSDFYMTYNLSIAVQALARDILMLPSLFSVEDVASLIKVLSFVCVLIETYATCCPFQTIQQGFGLGGYL